MESGLDKTIAIICFLIIGLFFFLFGYFMFNYVKPDEQTYQLGLAITFMVLILSLVNYKIGLYAFAIAVAVSPELVVMETPNFRIEDLLFPVMVLSWFTYFLKEKKEFTETGFTAPVVTFLGISIISYLLNIGFGNLHNVTTGFYEIGKLIQYFTIFIIFANSFEKISEIKQAISVLILSFFIAGIAGITVRHQTGYIYGPPGEGPNIQGGYYTLSLCIISGLLSTITNPLLWIGLVGVAGSIFYPLVYTLSRTSYVAFVTSITIIGIFKARKILLWLIVLFVFILSMKDTAFFERASSIFYIFTDKPPSSWEARVSGWQVYSRYFFQAPILGNGAGFTPRTIDNEYVKILVDKGLLGILTFLWLLLSFLKVALKAMKLTEESDVVIYGYSIGFVAATIAILIHSIGAVSFTVIRVAELYYMLLGLTVSIISAVKKEAKESKV
ncbi:MAG: O-antigen ligase family protein, partial [Planctomycetota bacterium]